MLVILPSSIFNFIEFIDSIYRGSLIDEETLLKPILFNFEREGSRPRDSQLVSPQTEYRLFTYLNNTKYYFNKSSKGAENTRFYYFDLRSAESKNTVKGIRHIL